MTEAADQSLSIIQALQDESEAAIEMLRSAMQGCPESLWDLREEERPFWHKAYHTIYFFDLYMTGSVDSFEAPSFHSPDLEKLAEAPPKSLSRAQLEGYLGRAEQKFRTLFDTLTLENLSRKPRFSRHQTLGAALLDNLRHIQHHVGQMYSFLRRKTGNAPKWVAGFK